MSKPVRVAASLLLLIGCAVTVVVAASQLIMTYQLPPTVPGGDPAETRTLFQPAIGASAVTVLLTLAAAGWLVWNLIQQPPKKLWLVAVGVLISAVATDLVLSGLSRPHF